MNFNSHRTIARLVAEKMDLAKIIGPENVEEFIKYTTFPDYCDDVTWKIGKTAYIDLLGHRFCSLTHFVRPVGGMKYMGYLLGKDGSITKFKKPGDGAHIVVNDAVWDEVLTKKRTEHPLTSLIKIPGYTDIPWMITYPTAAIMAERIAKNYLKKMWWRAAACIIHLACDAVIYHHARGLLFDGHSSYEGDLDEYIVKFAEEICDAHWPVIWESIQSEPVMTPREIVELMAETTGGWSSKPPFDFCVKRGIRVTAQTVRYFLKALSL